MDAKKILMIAVFLGGCSLECQISSHPIGDMATQYIWDGKCLGRPEDDGRVVYWRGPPYEPGDWGKLGTKYVCRDNGPPNHWWFVAIPEERPIP